jgi:tetratricopeptide (TPR) repeat protein
MRFSVIRIIGLVVLLIGLHYTFSAAQEQTPIPEATDALISTPDALVSSEVFLPDAISLAGLSPVYQQVNRCSAAALTIQLSYFQWEGNYSDTIRALNPHIEDVAVRLDEMAAFARQQGLGAVDRTGGTVELLKALVAGGFPVLVENSYFEGAGGYDDWLSHNRVIMGYDNAAGVFLSFDSLLGNGENNQGRPIPYDELDERWRPFNRDYLVLYRPEAEGRVQAILGDQWDVQANAVWTLAQSTVEIGTPIEDGFTWFNIGSSLLTLNRNDEAADAFDQAQAEGLPWRMLWYQYGPLEAYLRVGRNADVLAVAQNVLYTTPGVEEIYYYMGLAWEASGDLQRAEGYLESAVWRNEYFTGAWRTNSRSNGRGIDAAEHQNTFCYRPSPMLCSALAWAGFQRRATAGSTGCHRLRECGRLRAGSFTG